MNEKPEAYGGLPIPTYDEWERLQSELDSLMADEPNQLEEIYDHILTSGSGLQDVIDHDVTYFQTHEASEDLSIPELAEHAQGVRMGYGLVAGCFTYMYFARSGCSSLSDYIQTAPGRIGELPVMSHKEKMRIVKVRIGKANVDKMAHGDLVDDSSELADVNLANYLYEAIRMEDLLESAINQTLMESAAAYFASGETGEEPDRPYILGFWHGVANATEVYIQSREEQLFDSFREKAA